jgi:hypothetical protein
MTAVIGSARWAAVSTLSRTAAAVAAVGSSAALDLIEQHHAARRERGAQAGRVLGAARRVRDPHGQRLEARAQAGAQERGLADPGWRGHDHDAAMQHELGQLGQLAVATEQQAVVALVERGQAVEGRSLGQRSVGHVLPGQRRGEGGGGREPRGGIDRQRAGQRLAHARVVDARQHVGGRCQIGGAGAAPAGHQRDQHQRRGEQVGARVDPLVLELLGRHVRRRAADRGRGLVGAPQPREAEIDQHRAPAADDDVAWLHVGVHQAGAVRGVEAGEELAHQRDRVGERGRPGRDLHLQIAAIEQLHREEQPAVRGDVGLVDAHDVGVVDATDRLDLLHEQPTVLGERVDPGPHHLHRHVAADGQLARAVDDAEATLGEARVEPEAAGQDGAELRIVSDRAGGRAARGDRPAQAPQALERWRLEQVAVGVVAGRQRDARVDDRARDVRGQAGGRDGAAV